MYKGDVSEHKFADNEYVIIGAGMPKIRKIIYENLKKRNIKFYTLISKNSKINEFVEYGEANIFIYYVPSPDVKIGNGNLFNGYTITGHDVEIMNPDLVICTLDKGAVLNMELTVGTGKGYVPASANRPDDCPIGLIPVDSIFSPITKAVYQIDNARVGQITNYDKLSLTVETNGTVSPEDAVALAARILQEQLKLFVNFEEPEEDVETEKIHAISLRHGHERQPAGGLRRQGEGRRGGQYAAFCRKRSGGREHGQRTRNRAGK